MCTSCACEGILCNFLFPSCTYLKCRLLVRLLGSILLRLLINTLSHGGLQCPSVVIYTIMQGYWGRVKRVDPTVLSVVTVCMHVYVACMCVMYVHDICFYSMYSLEEVHIQLQEVIIRNGILLNALILLNRSNSAPGSIQRP